MRLYLLSLCVSVFGNKDSPVETGIKQLKAIGTSWLPEFPSAAINSLDRDDDYVITAKWETLVDNELKRSVEYFQKPEGLESMSQLKDLVSETRYNLIIRDSRLYVHESMYNKASAKTIKFINMIADISERYKLPNAVILFIASSTGYVSHDPSMLPHFVIAKKDGYNERGILMPNPYFADGNLFAKWSKDIALIRSEGRAKDELGIRKPHVFWRGAVRWDSKEQIDHYKHKHNECRDEEGNLARIKAVSLSVDPDNLWDVKCNVDCDIRSDPSSACTLAHATELDQADTHRMFANATLVSEMHHYQKFEYGNFMFNLNLPGKTEGSYSRNLNHLWFTGAVIVQWNWPSVEWYYPALSDGTTHISVNRSNAIAAVDIVRRSKPLIAHFRHFASLVGDTFLCSDCIAKYIIRALRVYRRELKYDEIFDNDAFFATEVACKKDELYEVYQVNGTDMNKLLKHRTVDCDEWRKVKES